MIRRRDFITLLGGAAFAWPLTARAQQRERMRRIGVLASNLTADDPEWQVRSNTFVQGLQERGWSDGRNVRIEYRWGLGDSDRLRECPRPSRRRLCRHLGAAGRQHHRIRECRIRNEREIA